MHYISDINDDLLSHKVEETILISNRFDGGYHMSLLFVKEGFEPIFYDLIHVEILQIVNDGQVIHVGAAAARELVPLQVIVCTLVCVGNYNAWLEAHGIVL